MYVVVYSHICFYVKREKTVPVQCLLKIRVMLLSLERMFMAELGLVADHSGRADLQITVLVCDQSERIYCQFTHLTLSITVFFPLVSLLEEYKDFSFGML